jgi:hypothetical protein
MAAAIVVVIPEIVPETNVRLRMEVDAACMLFSLSR